MQILEIKKRPNGSHLNQTYHGDLFEGWAFIPDDMELPNFPFGEVIAEEDKEKVVEPVINSFRMLLSGLQSREIVWESYPADSDKFPTIVIDENGVIDKFVTKADTNIGEFFGPIFDDFFASIKTKNGNKELK